MLPPTRSKFLAMVLAAWGAHAFTFTMVPEIPTECGSVIVNWSGGEPPFNLLVIPPTNPLQNISIAEQFYNPSSRSGSFSYQVRFARDTQILFAMSDRTGVTAGGITRLLRIGVPTGGASCNTTISPPDFFFNLEDNLKQCSNYEFTSYPNARGPLSIVGFVPGGESVEATDLDGGDSFTFFNRFPAGTDVTFFAKDSEGRNGGTSGLKTVISSTDDSCLVRTAAPKSTTNIGAIVGGVVGGLAFLGAVAFGVFFWKKRQNSRPQELAPVLAAESTFGAVGPLMTGPPAGAGGANLAHSHSMSGSMYQPDRRNTYYDPSVSGASAVTPYGVPPTPNYHPAPTVYSSDASTSAVSGIAPYGGYQPQTPYRNEKGRPPPTGETRRLIVHQDIEDSQQVEEPEELPPQYTEGRAPITGFASGSGQGSGPSNPPTGDRKG